MTPGLVIADRFEIERAAGSGGMGAVYRAIDRAGGAVAIKVLRSPADAERFAREAELLATLRHPAIVRHVAHGVTPEGSAWMAMEWLEGEDLSARLARRGLTVDESVRLAARVAGALAEAHGRGIVHRDIKPANLFLVGGDVDRVTVLDFGVARVGGASRAMTRTGVVIGTPGYMAPEQVKGERAVDARADVFALGCVLFECLTGEAAFTGDHLLALLAKILLADCPRARDLRPDVPAALDALVARMLAKEPSMRPPDGAALLDAIGALDRASGERPAPARAGGLAITGGEMRVFSLVMTPGARAASDPEAATAPPAEIARLDSEVRAAVALHGGHAEQLLDGSIVVSIAGAGAATDQAARAARCALSMRLLLPGAPIAVTTGSGEIAGRLPVGDAIERAVDLLRTTPGRAGAVRIDAVTAGLLGSRFRVEAAPEGHLLLGETDEDGGARTLLGVATPCVGRERDLAVLLGVFDECASERVARVSLVTAPAGMGKSRFAHELVARLRERGEAAAIWTAHGDAMRAGSAFAMLAQIVERAASVRGADPPEVRWQKLAARVAARVPRADAARVSEFLGELVGAPSPGEASLQLRAARADPLLMGDQVRRAFLDLVAAECAAGPVVLVLEDLHWGDLPTVRAIDAALQDLEGRPLLVVALARPEVHEVFPKLWAGRAAVEIRLGGLSRRAAEALAIEVLGERASPAVVARIVEQAAGNAFYLEELIRAVAEGRGDALPETVIAMTQTRLEALDPTIRRVLRAASVYGDVFWAGATAALLGAETGDRVREHLRELGEREIVTRRAEARFPGEDEYAFRHTLVREAAYAMLPDRDRAVGHRLAGEWLERAGESDPVVLAEHFERGGEPRRAIPWFSRAVEAAIRGIDFGAALACIDRAVRAGAEGEALGHLRALEAEIRIWQLAWEPGLRAALEAVALLPPGSEAWHFAICGAITVCADRSLDAELRPLLAGLLAQGFDVALTGPVAVGWNGVARVLTLTGRRAEAEPLFAALTRAEPRDPIALGWSRVSALIEAMFLRGLPDRGLAFAAEAVAAFEQGGDRRGVLIAKSFMGWALVELGAFERADALLREVAAATEQVGLRYGTIAARYLLSFARAGLGAFDEAIAIAEQERADFQAVGNRSHVGYVWVALSTFRMAKGDLDGAARAIDSAVEALAGIASNRIFLHGMLGLVRWMQGRVPEALEATRRAVELLDEQGGTGYGEWPVRLARASVLAGAGEIEAAREAIAEARRRLLARAETIADPDLRRSFLERVVVNAQILALAGALSPEEA